MSHVVILLHLDYLARGRIMMKYVVKGLAALLVVVLATVFVAVPVLAADLRGEETGSLLHVKGSEGAY